MPANPPLVLASASPRRKELLAMAGYRFQVMPSHSREKNYRLAPAAMVRRLAQDKANEVAHRLVKKGKVARVLGADTLVFLGGKALGKPKNLGQARGMLKSLSGRKHQVLTGLALIEPGFQVRLAHAKTDVWFRKLGEDELEGYLRSGEAMDKAGAYGIQGGAARFVSKLSGCYFNVVGLPMEATINLLSY